MMGRQHAETSTENAKDNRIYKKTNASRRGLGERLAFAFAVLLTTVAGLYGLAIVGSVGFTEEELISSFLRDELELAKNELEQGITPRKAPNTLIFGECKLEDDQCPSSDRLAPIPAIFQNVREGFTEITENPAAFVWRGEWKGGTLLIVKSQKGFEEKERMLFVAMAASILLVFLISTFLGSRLSRRVIRPVEQLSQAVRQSTSGVDWKEIPPELMTRDEVGELATICSESIKRLHEAFKREKAFTGDASHELRTTLTVIETSAELLEMGKLDAKQRTQVDRILRAVAQMRETMEILLEFARASTKEELTKGLAGGGNGEFTPPDSVAGIIRVAANRWSPFAEEKGLKFVVLRDATCPGIYSPAMLGIVLSNLLRNAIAYTVTGFIRIRETSSGLVVENSGDPISQAERERIFEPFKRGVVDAQEKNRKQEGWGLGLSIVQRISARMGWRVTLEVKGADPDGNGTPAVNAFFVDLVSDNVRRRADEVG